MSNRAKKIRCSFSQNFNLTIKTTEKSFRLTKLFKLKIDFFWKKLPILLLRGLVRRRTPRYIIFNTQHSIVKAKEKFLKNKVHVEI